MIARLRVGCTVFGWAPGVRRICSSVRFHWMTGSTGRAADRAWSAVADPRLAATIARTAATSSMGLMGLMGHLRSGMGARRSPSAPHRLDLQLDVHGLADQKAAADLEHHIPTRAVVLAVDLGPDAEARPLGAGRVPRPAQVAKLEGHRAGDVADGQVAVHRVPLVVDLPDRGAVEHEGREAFGLQELLAAQACVALLLARVDAAGRDLDVAGRALGRVGDRQDAPDVAEPSAHP